MEAKVLTQAAANVGQTKMQPSSDKSRNLHKAAMLAMWTSMAHAFGNWVSQYGTSENRAFQSWSTALADYSPEQIARGVRNATGPNWTSAFPPNLAEFGKLCLTKRYADPSHKPLEIEHHKPATESVKQRELKRQAHLRERGKLENETWQQSYQRLGLGRRW